MAKKVVGVVRTIASIGTWIVGFIGCYVLNSVIFNLVDRVARKVKGGD